MPLPVGSRGVTTGSPADRIDPLDAEDLRDRVHKSLDDLLARQSDVLDGVSDELAPLMDAVGDLLRGGKRLRPAFCYWGWRGAGGDDSAGIVTVASALELFQAAALIHDDVMDGSDIRRGQPAVHRRLAALHRGNRWLGPSEDFGVAGAILAGDLCLSWCDEMYAGSGLPAERLAAGRAVFDRMRTELMCGQYLDMLEQVLASTSVQRARHVILYKSAKYSVQQPLLLGGTLAGAPDELLRTYDDYGRALGEAFQLRDDVLGVFGDPGATGKPAGDDLREGKRTVLVAVTLERCSPAQAAAVRRSLGDPRLDPAGVDGLRAVMTECGALDVVESMIDDLSAKALRSLEGADVAGPAREVLEQLVAAATARSQ
jgi:geranylgeranyl diphosphate synthase type I